MSKVSLSKILQFQENLSKKENRLRSVSQPIDEMNQFQSINYPKFRQFTGMKTAVETLFHFVGNVPVDFLLDLLDYRKIKSY